jgi:hypothetical protein
MKTYRRGAARDRQSKGSVLALGCSTPSSGEFGRGAWELIQPRLRTSFAGNKPQSTFVVDLQYKNHVGGSGEQSYRMRAVIFAGAARLKFWISRFNQNAITASAALCPACSSSQGFPRSGAAANDVSRDDQGKRPLCEERPLGKGELECRVLWCRSPPMGA